MKQYLRDIIHQFANLWTSQPSDSKYQRRFNTDGEHYLMLREGELGGFNWFDWDNHRFYSEDVKGSYGLFSFKATKEYIIVSLSSYEIGKYASIEELQDAMKNHWIKIGLPNAQLAQQNHEAHTKIIQETLQTRIYEWLSSPYLQEFVCNENKKYGQINVFKSKHYLALWIGSSDAVWFGAEDFTLWSPADYDGRPRIRSNKIKAFAGLSLTITSESPMYYINQLVYEDSLIYLPYGTYNQSDHLLDGIRQALKKLEFSPIK